MATINLRTEEEERAEKQAERSFDVATTEAATELVKQIKERVASAEDANVLIDLSIAFRNVAEAMKARGR
jgi:hypothetical protein